MARYRSTRSGGDLRRAGAAKAGSTKAGPFTIRRPDQARALVSPVRQEMVDAVAAAGSCTIAQLAGWLGRRPDALYYHVAALTRVGLLIESGRARAGRRFCAVYDVPGRPMLLEYGGKLGHETIISVVRAALRLADRDFRRAFREPAAVTQGPGRTLWGGRVKGWVDEQDLIEVNELIARLTTILQRGTPRPGAHPQSFTYVLTPERASNRLVHPATDHDSGLRRRRPASPEEGTHA